VRAVAIRAQPCILMALGEQREKQGIWAVGIVRHQRLAFASGLGACSCGGRRRGQGPAGSPTWHSRDEPLPSHPPGSPLPTRALDPNAGQGGRRIPRGHAGPLRAARRRREGLVAQGPRHPRVPAIRLDRAVHGRGHADDLPRVQVGHGHLRGLPRGHAVQPHGPGVRPRARRDAGQLDRRAGGLHQAVLRVHGPRQRHLHRPDRQPPRPDVCLPAGGCRAGGCAACFVRRVASWVGDPSGLRVVAGARSRTQMHPA
jgi:hypothetical protein